MGSQLSVSLSRLLRRSRLLSSPIFILDSSFEFLNKQSKMALSDSDVQKQIKQMMGFIEQEANEKVEEIDAKAEEEFNIEKGRLVQQQRLKIMEFYERKEKQVELQKKIQSSNLLNQARLKVLQAQQQHIQNLLAETKERLSKASADSTSYSRVLRDLIIQALFQIMEPTVSIRCRQADLEMVENVLPEAMSLYNDAMKKPCQITVLKDNFLPANACGGVELAAFHGRIRVSNTLESRLEMIAGQMLPETRNGLFGQNTNRKFFD